MCRAKSEGGVRCVGHLRSLQEKYNSDMDYWTSEVESRTAKVEQANTSRNRRDLRIAERKVDESINGLGTVAVEMAEAEARRAAAEKKEKRTKTTFVGADLKESEWALLTEEAKALGFSNRSELIRSRLQQLPEIRGVEAVSTPRQEWAGSGNPYGRNPTQGRKAGYERENRGVRIDDGTLNRLEAEAEVFGLTRSDYTRCLLLDLDPRSLGHHIGKKNTEYIEGKLATQEEAHIITAQDAKTFWHDQVLEVRLKHPVSV